MKVNRQIIRGYDIRGDVTKDLDAELAEHIGRAYGTYMSKRGSKLAVVGYDCRSTSEEFTEALIKGITSTGMDVINIGLCLVGHIYWAQYFFKTKAGAMVTASHNPAEYNGFKLQIDYSESMILDTLGELMDIVENEEYLIAEKPGSVKQQSIQNEYFTDLINRVKIDHKFKVVIDASCATAGVIVPELLKRAGCEVVESNCVIDSSFPLGVADPTETNVAERLRDKIIEENADLGFSYDSDGDRIGIVDNKGTIIWNDVLVALFCIDVLNDHPGAKMMFNTLCSKVVTETIIKYGGEPFMWRTGHGFLKKKNQEIKAPFIGELSGHFFFSADFFNHDDGCYATLRLLNYLSRTNQSLNEAIMNLPKYISSPEIKLGCADDKKVSFIEMLSQKLKQDFKNAEVIDDERAGDGVRLETEDSMFVVRYSQNGPYLTIKFEAKTEEKYNELKKYLHDTLKQYPEIDWENKIIATVNAEALE